MNIFIDIETLPCDDEPRVDLVKKKLKPPGNLSKPDSIQAWLNNPSNLDKALRKTSFSGSLGTLLCIGYAIDDEEAKIITGDESDMLREFISVLRPSSRTQHQIIGHYVKGFDVPFLSQRMLVHGLGPIFKFGSRPWEMSASCTGEMFACGKKDIVSLDELCVAFGVDSPKDDIDGSMVYDLWKGGEHDRIYEYCKKDVEATRSVYQAMTKSAA